jgi:hypothetical protein
MRVLSDELLTIVLERLDESLIAMRGFLGWSLADLVVVKHRKSLSSHPKASEWPAEAVASIKKQLEEQGEYEIYRAAGEKLDARLRSLTKQGIDVKTELFMLRELKSRVTEVYYKFIITLLYAHVRSCI